MAKAKTVKENAETGAKERGIILTRDMSIEQLRAELTEAYGVIDDVNDALIGTDGIASFERENKRLRDCLDEIERVSCGEDQVADDDSEGMGWIYKRIQALKGK